MGEPCLAPYLAGFSGCRSCPTSGMARLMLKDKRSWGGDTDGSGRGKEGQGELTAPLQPCRVAWRCGWTCSPWTCQRPALPPIFPPGNQRSKEPPSQPTPGKTQGWGWSPASPLSCCCSMAQPGPLPGYLNHAGISRDPKAGGIEQCLPLPELLQKGGIPPVPSPAAPDLSCLCRLGN